MPRYIDADVLQKNLKYICTGGGKWGEAERMFIEAFSDFVDGIPTADVVEIKKEGEWEMFDLISSAYYGKRMYFKQDGGIVYSRYSSKYMNEDEAIQEFVSLIDDSIMP